jgi:hypothetical protein
MELTNTNLCFKNSGKYVGDNDGPAYVVYSKIGYNKATYEFHMSKAKINMKRNSDGKWTNSYIFLGIDVYDENEEFLNCIDTGFCYAGGSEEWHLFYNLLHTSESDTFSWYESPISLNPDHDYKLELDCTEKDGYATIRIFDMNEDYKLVDTATFEVLYLKADGSNVSLYQDYAIDFPEDIKRDRTGENYSEDWEEVVLYNTNEGIFLNNIVIKNATLYTPEGPCEWTEERNNDSFMWPSYEYKKIDYPCTRILEQNKFSDITLDLDMNRH